MKSINKVILVGNVGKEPETATTTGGVSVCKFSVATSESWKDDQGNKQEKTEWHNVVAWRKLADICAQYVRRGSRVYIEGKITTRSWDKDGTKHYMTEIVMNDLILLDGKTEPKPLGADELPTDRPKPEKDDLPF